MERRYYILAALLIGLFLYGVYDMTRVTPEQKALIAQLRSLNGLESVSLHSAQLSRIEFSTEITNKADLEFVEQLLRQADAEPVGSHNGSVFECMLFLKTKNGKSLKLAASVHEHQLTDLYLSPTLFVETKPGSFSREQPQMARIPRLGQWIMQKEPRGVR